MTFRKTKTPTGRVASARQLQSAKENFVLFQLKGLYGNIKHLVFYNSSIKCEELNEFKRQLENACHHLQAAEIVFKKLQKRRIENENPSKL